jgi:DNA primase
MLAGGVDPDSLVASGGAVQLREAIDRAQGGIEFFCFEVWGKAKANADSKTLALEDASRLAARVGNPLKRELVIDTLAKALDVETGVVRSAVQRAGSGRPADRPAVEHRGHPNAPVSAPAAPPAAKSPPIEEVEVISLLTDHPTLIASSDADKAFWLLTDETLRAMYSRAREGVSLLELAPERLPSQTAKHVLSGKYSDHKDPRGQLVAMTVGLEQRKHRIERTGIALDLADAKHSPDRELARLQARLAEAQRKGDRELVEKLVAEISTKRKQAK